MPRKRPLTIPISRRALLVRVNRKLGKKHHRFRADHRGGQTMYFLLDTTRGVILKADLDLEEFAREIGCIKPWERLAEGVA